MKRNPVLLLAAAAVLLPGCYAARKAVPLDASGMEYPLRHAGRAIDQQVELTGDAITGLPRSLSEHFRKCWRNITRDPSRM
jgi:hypothetical protein